MFEIFLLPETYISLLTLTLLEIVLGVDNIIFISILAGKLPSEQRQKARITGLVIALFGRLVLLSSIVWLTKLTTPLVNIGEFIHLSGKDLILLAGGLFLIWKSAQEIYDKVEHPNAEHQLQTDAKKVTMQSIIIQIILIDIVFSIDSILTAVGLVREILLMVIAVVISLGIMIWTAQSIGDFIDRHPSVKVLALSFLLMIGTVLVAEAFHHEIPRGYIYFSLAFSLFVEFINIKVKKKNISP